MLIAIQYRESVEVVKCRYWLMVPNVGITRFLVSIEKFAFFKKSVRGVPPYLSMRLQMAAQRLSTAAERDIAIANSGNPTFLGYSQNQSLGKNIWYPPVYADNTSLRYLGVLQKGVRWALQHAKSRALRTGTLPGSTVTRDRGGVNRGLAPSSISRSS